MLTHSYEMELVLQQAILQSTYVYPDNECMSHIRTQFDELICLIFFAITELASSWHVISMLNVETIYF